jgi:hypothetical protein
MNEFTIDIPSGSDLNGSQTNFTVNFKPSLLFPAPTLVALSEFGYRDFMLIDIGKFKIKFNNNNNILKYNLFAYDKEPVDHFVDRINNEIILHFSKLKYLIDIKKIKYDYDLEKYPNNFVIENWNKEYYSDNEYTKIYSQMQHEIPIIRKNSNNLYSITIPNSIDVYFEGRCLDLFQISEKAPKHHEFILLAEHFNFLDFIYVYCDLIEFKRVGSGTKQLLKIIGKTGEFNKTVHLIFTDNDYCLVGKSQTSTINIDLRDKTGEPIKFASLNSEVQVKLKFKPA